MFILFAPRTSSISTITRASPRATSMLLLPQGYTTPVTSRRRTHTNSLSSSSSKTSIESTQPLEKFFIQALVRAGQCSGHVTPSGIHGVENNSNKCRSSKQPPQCSMQKSARRRFSTKSNKEVPAEDTTYTVSKQELKDLVDFYALPSSEEDDADTPGLGYGQEGLMPVPDEIAESERLNIERTIQTMRNLLQDTETPHEHLWSIYQTLPQPRASHLPPKLLKDLLHHLSVVPVKTESSMLRYLTLIEDLKTINFTLNRSAWTSAIAFAGRCLKAVSSVEVDSALQLWRQMEQEDGSKSTDVTFNVLFDIATKAGKFVLAEMIMKEMKTRQLEPSRYFRTGLIYHYGLRSDGNGVRRAYRELVDAGEVVDSAVVACVIKSLLRCGEAIAAEQVFERAKRLHGSKITQYQQQVAFANANISSGGEDDSTAVTRPLRPPAEPPEYWRAARTLGLALDKSSRTLRQTPDPSTYHKIQESVSLAPSSRSYYALIYHHAVTIGDIDRATELIHEMQDTGMQLHGGVYLMLFKGFSMHGNVAYTAWTRRRLENTWKQFGAAIDSFGMGWVRGKAEGEPEHVERLRWDQPKDKAPVYMSLVAAEYVLRAYGKVVGYERTLQIWSEILARWGVGNGNVGREDKDDEARAHTVNEVAMAHVEKVLARLFPDVFDPLDEPSEEEIEREDEDEEHDSDAGREQELEESEELGR